MESVGSWLNQWRAAVVGSEKLVVVEARDSSGTQTKRNVSHWKLLSSNG
jgi:predicted DNA-binding transcriptional regulator YafY